MKKEYLYACLCVFVITLTICTICATMSYCNKKTKPIATLKFGHVIEYSVQVPSPLDAARQYQLLKIGWDKAIWEQEEAKRIAKEAEEDLDRLKNDPDAWFKE